MDSSDFEIISTGSSGMNMNMEEPENILRVNFSKNWEVELIRLEHSYAVNTELEKEDCTMETEQHDLESKISSEESPTCKEMPIRRSQRQIEKHERELLEKNAAVVEDPQNETDGKTKVEKSRENNLSKDVQKENSLVSEALSNFKLIEAENFKIEKEHKLLLEESKNVSDQIEVEKKLTENSVADVGEPLNRQKKTGKKSGLKRNLEHNLGTELKQKATRPKIAAKFVDELNTKAVNSDVDFEIKRKRIRSELLEEDSPKFADKSDRAKVLRSRKSRNVSIGKINALSSKECESKSMKTSVDAKRKRNPSAPSGGIKLSKFNSKTEVCNSGRRKKCLSLSEDAISCNKSIVERKKSLSVDNKGPSPTAGKNVTTVITPKSCKQRKVMRRESLKLNFNDDEPPLFSQPDVMVKVKVDDFQNKKEEKEKLDAEGKIEVLSENNIEEHNNIDEQSRTVQLKSTKSEESISKVSDSMMNVPCPAPLQKIEESKLMQEVGTEKHLCVNASSLTKLSVGKSTKPTTVENNITIENSTVQVADSKPKAEPVSVVDNVQQISVDKLNSERDITEADIPCDYVSEPVVDEKPRAGRKSCRLIKKKEFFEDISSRESSVQKKGQQNKKSPAEKQNLSEKCTAKNTGMSKKQRQNAGTDVATESSSEDDPEKLWCICRQPHNDRFMIQCDVCEDWFHGTCVGVTRQQGRQLEKQKKEWWCPNCRVKNADGMKTVNNVHSEENIQNEEAKASHIVNFEQVQPHEQHPYKNRKKTSIVGENAIVSSEISAKKKSSSNQNLEKVRSLLKDNKPITSGKESMKKDVLPNDEPKHVPKILKVNSIGDSTDDQPKLCSPQKTPNSINLSSQQNKKSPARNTNRSSNVVTNVKKKCTSTKPLASRDMPKKKQCCVTCQNLARLNSCYCSDQCIEKHAEDCLNVMRESKGAPKGNEFDSQRLVVFDRIKGNVITSDHGPTAGEIVSWLKANPSFMIACSSSFSSSSKKAGNLQSKKKEPDSSATTEPKKDTPDDSAKVTVRFNVRKTLKNILMDRCKNADDIQLPEEEIRRIAVRIEEELHSLFKDNSFKYRAKYRSLMFNIKDPRNQGLFRKILKGTIPPDRLVRMSSEELASVELAKWREQENQHLLDMIKRVQLEQQKTGSGLLLKKTHKGEVEIEDDFTNIIEQDVPKSGQKFLPDEATESDKSDSQDIPKDTTHLHRSHLFDLNCKICTGKVVPPIEEDTPKKVRVAHSISVDMSSPTTVDSVEKSVSKVDERSPVSYTGDDSLDQEPTSTVSIGSPEVTSKSITKENESKMACSVWKGFILMQDVAKFVTSAYKVSGQTEQLHVDLPDTIQVCGRIIPDQVWDYLSKIKQSGNKELIIIRFQPANEEEALTYRSFYFYLSSRKRYGVVSNYSKKIKDFYILPLAATSPVPIVLMPFDGPGLPSPRPHLLLGVIVRHRIKPAVQPTAKQQQFEVDGGNVDASYTPPLEARSYTPPLPALSSDSSVDTNSVSFYNPSADLKVVASTEVSSLESSFISPEDSKQNSDSKYELSYTPPLEKQLKIPPRERDEDKPYDPEQDILNIDPQTHELKLSLNESAEKSDVPASENLEKHKKILDALTRQVEETDRQVNALKHLISLPDDSEDYNSPIAQTIDINCVSGSGMSSFLDLPENLQEILNVVRLKSYDKDKPIHEKGDVDMRISSLFDQNISERAEADTSTYKRTSNVSCDLDKMAGDPDEKCSSQGATPPPDDDEDSSVARPSDPRIKLRTSFQETSFPTEESANISLSSMSVSELVERAQKQLAEMEAGEQAFIPKHNASESPENSTPSNSVNKLSSGGWNQYKEPPPPGLEQAEIPCQENPYSSKTGASASIPDNSVPSSYSAAPLVQEASHIGPAFPPPPPPPLPSSFQTHLPPGFSVQTPPPNIKNFPPPPVLSTSFPPPPLPISNIPPKGADNHILEEQWPSWNMPAPQAKDGTWQGRMPQWDETWEQHQGRHPLEYSENSSQYFPLQRSDFHDESFYENDLSSEIQWNRSSQGYDRGNWHKRPRGNRWGNHRRGRRTFRFRKNRRN